MNWLRRLLNRRVISRLKAERSMTAVEMAKQTSWDGTPANLVARHDALTHAIDLLESDYH